MLINASIFAELTFIQLEQKRVYWTTVAFLIVSLAGGWWIFMESSSPAMKQWVSAFRTDRVLINDEDGSFRLGRWLNAHRRPTLIDENIAFKAIVARGDAEGLYLSFSDKFKIALNQAYPDIDQIVVSDPDSPQGKRDRISIRYAGIYEHGIKGFKLVYSDHIWRVYRKI